MNIQGSFGGSTVASYVQTYMAIVSAGQIFYVPIVKLGDGQIIYGKPEPCTKFRDDPDLKRWNTATQAMPFDTPHGKISVYLPSDIRAGDTISGTVLPEPAGNAPEQRIANMAQLRGYVIDVEGKRNPVSYGRVLLTVAQAGGMVPFVLRDPAGNSAGLIAAATTPPELIQQPPAVAAMSPAATPIAMPGQFDGNSANTAATINGQPAQIIAESPRQAMVDCPPNLVGPAEIAVTDKGQTTTARTNVIGIDLSAPRTTLMRGEKTAMTMQVMGLQGLKEPVRVRLEASPNVRLQGGNSQTVVIDPARAGPGGVFTARYQLSFQAPGEFQVSATLVPQGDMAAAPAPANQQPPAPAPSTRLRRIGM